MTINLKVLLEHIYIFFFIFKIFFIYLFKDPLSMNPTLLIISISQSMPKCHSLLHFLPFSLYNSIFIQTDDPSLDLLSRATSRSMGRSSELHPSINDLRFPVRPSPASPESTKSVYHYQRYYI
jgi:hypothetical protein